MAAIAEVAGMSPGLIYRYFDSKNAIILAIIVLHEQRQLDGWFYGGVAIILAAVFMHPLVTRRSVTRPPEVVLGAAESKQ